MRRLLLLGAPRLEQDRRLVPVPRRKALALLAYLAVTGRPHPREALAALLFPDAAPAKGLAYIRNALWTLNAAAGDDWCLIAAETVCLNPAAGIEVDVQQFRAGAAAATPDALTAAAGLWRGDFMAGLTLDDCPDFADWRSVEAQSLQQEYAGVLHRLSAALAEAGRLEEALTLARRWLALDTLDERAHRQLMQLYARAGRRAEALRQYQTLAHLLQVELGTAPDAASQALLATLRQPPTPAPTVTATATPTAVSPSSPRWMQKAPPAPAAAAAGSRVFLPPQPTPFIPRAADEATLRGLLARPDCRLVTLVGPGGTGKTRLAIHIAAALAEEFPDGVYFVALAPVCYPEFVADTIVNVLTLAQVSGEDARRQLLNALRGQRLLLVLDNFEHLSESAPLVGEMLAHAPHIKLLVTSRERLHLQPEWLFVTGGLPHPLALEDQRLESYPAVQLFLQSARRLRHDFQPDDPAALVALCRLVEGLPLALELAATWVPLLPVRAIVEHIRAGMDVLATTARDVPERHRSLRAVFEYSWARLDAPAQTVLSRLAFFRGGFTPAAAQAVAGASLPLLLALLEKSLLRRSGLDGDGRFEMHELLRQYAGQKADPADVAAVADRHSQYMLHWLATLREAIRSPQEPAAYRLIRAEIDNVRGALRHAIDRHDVPALAGALYPVGMFYSTFSHLDESLELYQRLAQSLHADSPDPAERRLLGQTLVALGRTQRTLGHTEAMEVAIAQALPLLQQFPDEVDTAFYLQLAARARNRSGQKVEQALALARTALDICERHGDRYGQAMALYVIGSVEHNFMYYDVGRAHLEHSLRLFREIGQPGSLVMVLNMLTEAARTRGDYATARACTTEALALAREIGSATAIQAISNVLVGLDDSTDLDAQVERLLASLALYQESGERSMVAWTEYNLGWLLCELGRHEPARQYQARALAHFRAMQTLEGELWALIVGGMIELSAGDYA
ncbi:MAG: AAA family ATPase, partial [Anaerolineae bacterium]|nr:AAA family ATPase [Anaerolineae bacterium]